LKVAKSPKRLAQAVELIIIEAKTDGYRRIDSVPLSLSLGIYDCSHRLSVECAEGEVLNLAAFLQFCVGSFSTKPMVLPAISL
jgi:hypothetical protein